MAMPPAPAAEALKPSAVAPSSVACAPCPKALLCDAVAPAPWPTATLSPLATLSKPIAVLSPSAALLTPTAVLPPRARAAVVSELSSTAKYGEPPAAARDALHWATLTELGRASCRERVCQD